jgi:hypothetical protein
MVEQFQAMVDGVAVSATPRFSRLFPQWVCLPNAAKRLDTVGVYTKISPKTTIPPEPRYGSSAYKDREHPEAFAIRQPYKRIAEQAAGDG